MNRNYTLSKESTGLLVVDVQERLMNQVKNGFDVLYRMQQVIRGFQILQIPIIVTEQNPQGLGSTVAVLKECLGPSQNYFSKTTFSCLGDLAIQEHLLTYSVENWVLVGLEAHICVLQTAKSLLSSDKQVVVLSDAIASRSIYDFFTGIAELRDIGARVSSVETVLFEILQNSKAPEFKSISDLVKC
jgi:nicotinamidase-related amidase